MIRGRVYNTHKVVTIPGNTLIVLHGILDGQNVRVLKDDRFNRNVVSWRLLKKFLHCLNVVDDELLVHHSYKDS